MVVVRSFYAKFVKGQKGFRNVIIREKVYMQGRIDLPFIDSSVQCVMRAGKKQVNP